MNDKINGHEAIHEPGDNQAQATPTIEIEETVVVPETLTLPVRTDKHGRIWPAAGLMYQRLLSVEQLEDAGVKVSFVDAKTGEPQDHDRMLELITARALDTQDGVRAEFED